MAKGKFNGGGMPMGNMNNIVKQAQRLQQQMTEAQASLAEETMTATSGGGMIEVTMNGKHELTAIKINPEVVDPEDVEVLEDMILAAVNEVTKKLDDHAEEVMGKFSAGMPSIPGLF